jgi:ceramide glucosyltransferase
MFSVFLICFLLTWHVDSRKRYRSPPPLATRPQSPVPGVSILRPLKGLDLNLYENLESTFTQEYPNFEILFSVADQDDQALPVVRDLLEKYSNVNAKVIIGGRWSIYFSTINDFEYTGEEVVGVNPKVNNLIRSYREAANDIIWVLDSNVMATPGTLARSVDALSSSGHPKRTGLVHHVPFAIASGATLGSKIEEAFLNTNHAKMYVAINTVAVESCVVGKSNLYRRSDLERVNGSLKPISPSAEGPCQQGERGLAVFGRFLAEDNMIGSALWHELGLRHELSCDVARNIVGNMTFSDYVWRRVRWIRVRKHMEFAATLLEPLTESVVLSIIGFASLRHLTDLPAWAFFIVHFPLWLLVDLDVYASLAGHPVPNAMRWKFIGAWAAREVLALPVWLVAIIGDEVEWRGRKYQVLRNGEVRRAGGDSSGSAWFSRERIPRDYERLDTDISQ